MIASVPNVYRFVNLAVEARHRRRAAEIIPIEPESHRFVPVRLNIDTWRRLLDVMVRLDRTICINTMVRVRVWSSRTMTGSGESTSTRTGIKPSPATRAEAGQQYG